jgi:hypothetical protein
MHTGATPTAQVKKLIAEAEERNAEMAAELETEVKKDAAVHVLDATLGLEPEGVGGGGGGSGGSGGDGQCKPRINFI